MSYSGQRASDVLTFEAGYENDEKYAMIPEVGVGFNSNSFFRGAIEHAGFSDSVVVPSCFRPPGVSKILTIA